MSATYLSAMPPYVFWELDRRRSALRATGRSFVDLGIGSPDQPIPEVVREAMRAAIAEPALSGYPYFRGHPDYLEAIQSFLATRFALSVNPAKELLALAGSKEGFTELVLSQVDPGDVVLIPEIYYPVYARAPQLAGALPACVPFNDDGGLALDAIAATDLARARILVVNYPSNPTTATVSLAEMARYVEFARAHNLLLISDLAYSELSFDGFVVPSVLQVPGAIDVAVELHSCSKSFNMAGVRIAFAVGNQAAIERLDQYRANIGYGVSTLAQRAGAAAFANAALLIPAIVSEYRARRDALVAAFRQQQWAVESPLGSMYLWLKIPEPFDDWGWVDSLMHGPGIVVTPGIAFGEAGRGHFRISLVQPSHVLGDAAVHIANTAKMATS